MKTFALLCAVTTAVLWPAFSTRAGTHTWNGGSTDGRWSVPSNWDGNSPPFANESPLHLVFPASATRRLATNNVANISIDSITFDGAAYTLAASGQGTNVTFDSSVGQLYWNVRVFGGTGHTLHYSMNLALDGPLEFNVATNASVTVRSRLSAATAGSGLSKDGPGTVRLDPIADNTFDGATTVRDGTLMLEGSHFFLGFETSDLTIPGPLIIGGDSLAQHPRCVLNFPSQIADTAPVTVNRNGELLLAEVNDTIGALTIQGGSVEAFNSTLGLNGDVLIQNPTDGHPGEILGRIHLGTIGRLFTVETNAFLEVSAIISGGTFGNTAAGVTKNGPGWMSLSASSNTFGGYLHVAAGTLAFSSEKQLGAHTNGTSVASNAVLALIGVGSGPSVFTEPLSLAGGARVQALIDSEWNGPVALSSGQAFLDVPTNVTLTVGGLVSGAGGFQKTGPGTLMFLGDNHNTFTGPVLITEGEMQLANNFLFSPRLSLTGPLTVGDTNESHAAVVRFLASDQLATNAPVRFLANGRMFLQNRQQTFGGLIFSGGELDSGPTGLSRLAGDVIATNFNGYDFPVLRGRVDLGGEPRTFHVQKEQFYLQANVSGGAGASLIKTGPQTMYLQGSNSYAGPTLLQEGTTIVTDNNALGSTAGATYVASGACLYLSAVSAPGQRLVIGNEALHLSGPGNYFGGALTAFGTNTWFGSVTLDADAVIDVVHPTNQLMLLGYLGGPGGFTKTGPGRLLLEGAGLFNNTYAGATVVEEGELSLHKEQFPFVNRAVPGALVIGQPGGPPASVKVSSPAQLSGAGSVVLHPAGTLDFTGAQMNSIGSLAGAGVVNFAAGARLVTGLNNSNTTFSGTLQGGGVNDTNLSMQSGAGIFSLAGTNTLAGKMEVTGGTLRINSAQPSARVEVKIQGTLGGTGSVNTVTMRGGYLAPGAPLGRLHAGTFNVAQSHALQLDLHGPALGTGYDQFEVDAAPNFASTQFGAALGNGFNPTNGQQFLVVRNNSGAPTTPFLAFAEGAIFYVDDTHRMQITYLGGDGNDVVLKVIPAPGQFKGLTVDGNRAYLTGCGTPGASYNLEATETVGDPLSWLNLGSIVAGPDGLLPFVDSDLHNHPQRFFRFVLP